MCPVGGSCLAVVGFCLEVSVVFGFLSWGFCPEKDTEGRFVEQPPVSNHALVGHALFDIVHLSSVLFDNPGFDGVQRRHDIARQNA